MYVGTKMEEVRQLMKKVIEMEYKDALAKGLLDSYSVSNKIWNLLEGNPTRNEMMIQFNKI